MKLRPTVAVVGDAPAFPSRRARGHGRRRRVPILLLVTLALSVLPGLAADVLFVRTAATPETTELPIEVAARFYGLELAPVTVDPDTQTGRGELGRRLRSHRTVAVILTADALPALDRAAVFAALRRDPGAPVPLLIAGVTPTTPSHLLEEWSGGAVLACESVPGTVGPAELEIGRIEGVTRQLSGAALPFPEGQASYLIVSGDKKAQTRKAVALRGKDLLVPLMVEVTVAGRTMYMQSEVVPAPGVADSPDLVPAFTAALREILFIRSAAGERGWHGPGHYANLTIDDAWLIQPFGNLDYAGLLAEMKKHNFHTTVAFVPWNFDRSRPEVVQMFRSHPDRYSVTIHGNNHDHKEFTDYREKPLERQMADIRQAVARMEKFRDLTGIAYDRVMVFPHSIAPLETLAALKQHNYLATVNSINVPMDAEPLRDGLFALRPATLLFAGFPSIRRYSVEYPLPEGIIAVNAFLDNPQFFYGHEGYFREGVQAFNAVADAVNQLQPDTVWASLGEIVEHLYVVRLRDDHDYDVLAFSSRLRLENPTNRDVIFYVERPEEDGARIAAVRIDGQHQPYTLSGTSLRFRVPLQAGQSREVVIEYADDTDWGAVDTSKSSSRIRFLRWASDLRDLTLSQSAMGRAFTDLYYANRGLAFTLVAMITLLMGVFTAVGARRLVHRSAGKRATH